MNRRDGVVIVDKWIDPKESTPEHAVMLSSHQRCDVRKRFQARAWDKHAPPRRSGGRLGRYLTKSFATIRAAREWGQEKRVEFTKGVASAVRTMVADLGDLYVETLNNRIGDPPTQRHLDQVRQVINGLVAAGARDITAPEFPDLVQRWISRLQAQRTWQRTARPASPSLKVKFLTIARALITFARERRFVAYDPLATVKTSRLATFRRQVFTVDELRRLVSDDYRYKQGRTWQLTRAAFDRHGSLTDAAHELGVSVSTVHYRLKQGLTEDPWWMVAVLCAYLGCRISTAMALTPRNVDVVERQIAIPANFPGNKTKLEMLIPMQPELRDILTGVLGKPDVAVNEPLVGNHFKTYLAANITNGFKDYVRRTGTVPGVRGPHALRHSFCSLMTALGVSPFTVMGLVGHLTAQVHKNYTQSAVQYQRSVAHWPRRARFYLRSDPPAHACPVEEAG